jgi:hypothetical protein
MKTCGVKGEAGYLFCGRAWGRVIDDRCSLLTGRYFAGTGPAFSVALRHKRSKQGAAITAPNLTLLCKFHQKVYTQAML